MFGIFKKRIELTDEQLKWNKMWDLWAKEKIDSPYHELMTYQSEINNGGHSQYFINIENCGNIKEEISALNQLLSSKMKSNLQKAYQAYLILAENDEEAELIMEKCDNVYYKNEEEITHLLEEFAAKIQL